MVFVIWRRDPKAFVGELAAGLSARIGKLFKLGLPRRGRLA